LGWLWTLYLLWHSPGTFTQDEIGHFVIARDAWRSPSLIFNDWGRAVNTLIYMIPALFGLTCARVAATAMAAATVILTAKLAEKLRAQYYFAIPIVMWFQLWYCDFAHTAITEIPFSLLMVLCTYLLVSGELLAGSIVIGLAPYVRTEGIALTLVWVVYCLWKKNWSSTTIALLPMMVVSLVNRLIFGTSHLAMYARTHPIGELQMKLYGVGPWSHYPKVLINSVGLPVMIMAVYAFAAILKRSARLQVFTLYGLYLCIHMVVYHFGLYGGGGDHRYVFPLAPVIGLAAVFGLEYIAEVCRSAGSRIFISNQKWLTRAVVTGLLALVVLDGVRYTTRPLDAEAVEAKMTADWLREQKLADHPLVSTHVWFYYYLPLRVTQGLWMQNPEVLLAAKPGTIAIWDSHYSEIFGLPLASLSRTNGWGLLHEFDSPSTEIRGDVDGLNPARFLVFEKSNSGSSTSDPPASATATR
jgi:hypothetical protein